MTTRRIGLMVAILIAIALPVSRLSAEEVVPELFGTPDVNQMLDVRSSAISVMEMVVKSSQIVTLNESVLRTGRMNVRLGAAAYLADRVSTASRQDHQSVGSMTTWSLEGAMPSVITVRNGMIMATFFTADHRQFVLMPGQIGQPQQLVEIASTAGEYLRSQNGHDDVVAISLIASVTRPVVNRVAGQGGYEVTLMGAYDQDQADFMGSDAAAELLITNKVDCTNVSLLNSGYRDGHFRLVHIQKWNHARTGSPPADLDSLAHDSVVGQARAQYRADVVIGVVGFGGGMAYLPTNSQSFSREIGFVVVSGGGMIANFQLEHELGHLLACQHDRAHASLGPEYALVPQAYGYNDACHSDVMSYIGERAAFYSSAIGTFEGCPMGSPSEDNLKAIRLAFPLVSQYYPDTCSSSATALCLQNAGGQSPRFQIAVSWATALGTTGSGQAVTDTADTGKFWFFDPDNVELVVKVLDGRGVNDRFWVFAAGLTDVEVFLSVADTVTGQSKIYHNPMGTKFVPIQDVEAF